MGADQEDAQGNNSGAVYVIRGGAHLNHTQNIDLADFGSTALAGHLAKVVPPADSAGLHLGATCAAADLDGNERAEVMVSAALNRSGASVDALGTPGGSAESRGGTEKGTLYIAWDDNFAGETCASGLTIVLDAAPGALTVIEGGERNEVFGEEVIGGVDFDADGKADLFVGDLIGDYAANDRNGSGVGHVLYDAASLKGLSFSMDDLPDGLNTTTILGAEAGVISSDTSMVGDFDGDGIADLGTGSPKVEALGRTIAGTIHILFGKMGRWPEVIDLSNVEVIAQEDVRITTIVGANGTLGDDRGDMICYSGVAADMDGDGRHEVITNEMLGNGVDPLAIDVGNLVVISGTKLGTAP